MVTEAARSLQATAQAVLQEMEPLTQVGSHPLRQRLEELGAAPRGDLGSGIAGEVGAKTRAVLSAPPVPPAKLPTTSVSMYHGRRS